MCRAPSWLTVQEWSAGSRHRSTSTPSRWPRSARSPNSWLTSLMYGVSPLAAQAPENSEQGLEELDVLDEAQVQPAPIGLGQAEEEAPVLGLLLADRRLRHHVDDLVTHPVALALGRAHFDTGAAAGAVLQGRLQGEVRPGTPASAAAVLKPIGASASASGRTTFARITVRADEHALATGCTAPRPTPGSPRDVALLPLGRSARVGAVPRPGHSQGSASPSPAIIGRPPPGRTPARHPRCRGAPIRTTRDSTERGPRGDDPACCPPPRSSSGPRPRRACCRSSR